jgi:hypothetical protein
MTPAKSCWSPGLDPFVVKERDKELDFIVNHSTIPEHLKGRFIDFLKNHLDLWRGHQFSTKVYPPEKCIHDVELTENLSELRCKPYTCTGIRLQQLKETVARDF